MRRMFALIMFVIVFFIVNNSSLAAEKLIDANGWNKAQWGMSKGQLLEAFIGQAVEVEKKPTPGNKETYIEVKIPKYTIDDTEFSVSFRMSNKDDKLQGVHLLREPGTELKFTDFKMLFTQKYGPPQQDELSRMTGGNYRRTAAWILPSSKIELTYITVREFGRTFLSIVYTDNKSDKATLDKL